MYPKSFFNKFFAAKIEVPEVDDIQEVCKRRFSESNSADEKDQGSDACNQAKKATRKREGFFVSDEAREERAGYSEAQI